MGKCLPVTLGAAFIFWAHMLAFSLYIQRIINKLNMPTEFILQSHCYTFWYFSLLGFWGISAEFCRINQNSGGGGYMRDAGPTVNEGRWNSLEISGTFCGILLAQISGRTNYQCYSACFSENII